MPPNPFDTASAKSVASGPGAPVARAVADDLESIFPPRASPAARGERHVRLGSRARGPDRTRRRGERRAATLGAVIAAGCVGVTAGALFSRPAAPVRSASPPQAELAARPTPALPSPGPLSLPAAPLQTAKLAPPAGPAPLQTPKVAPPAGPAPFHTARLARHARAAQPAPAKLRKTATHRTVAPRPKGKRMVAACGGANGCSHSAVMAADARLRRAYAAAVRAGTSREVLADYRWEWGRLRYRAPRQPKQVADRYNQMASELNRIAARRRVVRAERRPANAWRSVDTQFAALWR